MGNLPEDLIACVLMVTLVVPFIYVDHYQLCSVRNSNLISLQPNENKALYNNKNVTARKKKYDCNSRHDPYLRPQFLVKDGPVPVNRFSPDKRKKNAD